MIKWEEQRPDVGPRPVSQRTDINDADPVAGQGERELPSEDGPVVVWSAQCREKIFAHLGQYNFEQGGLLLGSVWHLELQPEAIVCIDVVDSVAATQAQGTAISLSMGTELWDQARQQARDGQHIVGWYHSHPGLGAFFSTVDRNTQAAFFRESAWFRGIDSVEVTSDLIALHDDIEQQC